MKRFSHPTVWSSLALLPAAALLASRGALLIAAVYTASSAAAVLYHLHAEERFVEVDHILAWSVIVANCAMCLRSSNAVVSWAGVFMVAVALVFYRAARSHRHRYSLWHSLWHLACGLAGWFFALGYAL